MSVAISFERSYYEASVNRPSLTPPLAGETSADVCVVGGGFTGFSCALELAQRGYRVVLLEAQAIGWGASGRSGGQMIHGYSTSDLKAPAKMADVSEKMLFDFSLQAMDLVRERVREHNIQCDLRQGFADAAVKESHLLELRQWAEKAEKEYDYPHLKVLDAPRFREIVTSRVYCGGMLDDNSGHLHPLKYLLGLAQAAIAAGVDVHETSAVMAIDKNATGVAVRTAAGVVRCGRVVVACNAYNTGLLPQSLARIMPVGTYIGATPPLGDVADNLIIGNRAVCNSNFVLDYYRCSADKRLLFGGRVSYSTRPPVDIGKSIHRRMTHVFPQLSGVSFDYVWGGYVAITINRFPDIGREDDTVYYAQGFSGHGVALSGFAGKIIADAVAGDAEKLDVFNRIRHRPFPGGTLLRMPLLVLAMLYYRLRDLL